MLGALNVPEVAECVEALQPIVDRCARDSRFNAGNIIVDTMPWGGGPGTAIDSTKIRYVMAPRHYIGRPGKVKGK